MPLDGSKERKMRAKNRELAAMAISGLLEWEPMHSSGFFPKKKPHCWNFAAAHLTLKLL
jgi:hypothetical protein